MKLPERGDCIHCVVCKFEDQVCPMECGYFEEADLIANKELVANVCSDMLYAVLTFSDIGYKGVCGQTVGADGSGEYAKLFYSDSEEKAIGAAHAYVRKLQETHGRRIKEIHLIYGEGYSGDFIEKISV